MTDDPIAAPCWARYPSTSRDPNTRIVHCDLPSGHDGDHCETDTESTWPQLTDPPHRFDSAGECADLIAEARGEAWRDGVRWAAAEVDAQASWREPVYILDMTDHLRLCADNPDRKSAVPRDAAPTGYVGDGEVPEPAWMGLLNTAVEDMVGQAEQRGRDQAAALIAEVRKVANGWLADGPGGPTRVLAARVLDLTESLATAEEGPDRD